MQVLWDKWETESPFGTLTVAVTENGLCYIGFEDERLEQWCQSSIFDAHIIQDSTRLHPYVSQLKEYFLGIRKTFSVPLDLYGTKFQKRVWTALQSIPYGEVCSYKTIAIAIDSPKAVRAVGGANNKNPIPIIIPCHRVIGINGKLVGYGGGLDKKEYLLSMEQKLA
ncbi:methylated-DNA--[protein]-cysteine S-methyltransferase [Shimazuella kribbensis]|uniref:methylated-DNA--[protein]-cysteine S-methyltransferase n=1 Tax=Shimazuella kribbensis TaxID=139808 RepID=UPI0003F8BBE7|nr:methylated-DNA--[protein]-cysteine S-methyltransferase [Shimazuella kribbensis]